MIRPQPCHWFEVVVARDDAFIALEALAGAGTAEIEWHTRDSIAAPSSRPDELLKRYAALAQRYRPYWPPPATHREAESKAPADALAAAIDGRLQLLKIHLPYHESDHVLNIAYNLLAGGGCLEHLEWRRNDEVYLDALGARRIPEPGGARRLAARRAGPEPRRGAARAAALTRPGPPRFGAFRGPRGQWGAVKGDSTP